MDDPKQPMTTAGTKPPLGGRIVEVALLLTLILSLGWVMVRAFTVADYRLDAEVFYVAGWAVDHGQSPYSTGLSTDQWHQALGKEGHEGQVFAYPPTALPFVALLALLPPQGAFLLVDAVNALAMVAILVLLARFLIHFQPGISRKTIWAALILAVVPAALSLNFTYGQSSLMIFAASLFAAYSLVRSRPLRAVVVFVFFVALKPQLTIVPMAALFLLFSRPKTWIAAALGLVAWAGVCTLWFGPSMFSGFLGVLTSYGSYSSNGFENMSGIGLLLAPLGISLGLSAAVALAAVFLALILGGKFFGQERSLAAVTEPRRQALMVLTIFLVNEFTLSLHDYDHSMLLFPLALAVLLPWKWRISLLVPLLVAARPVLVTAFLGSESAKMAVITCAGVVATGVAVAAFLTYRPAKP